MSADLSPALQFEQLVRDLLTSVGFEIADRGRRGPDAGIDFAGQLGDERWLVQVKFYRTERPQPSLIQTAAAFLAAAAANQEGARRLLVISGSLTAIQRSSVEGRYEVVLLDRRDLLNLAQLTPHLLETLVGLLGAGDTDEESEVGRLSQFSSRLSASTLFDRHLSDALYRSQVFRENAPARWGAVVRPGNEGSLLCQQLRSLAPGRAGGAWRRYEKLCVRILKYLFPAGLHGWHEQKGSDDGLNRVDLVCRVTPDAEFWRFIVQDVKSRYLLFEFKNYARPITQGQVLTTEKYLLERGLRRVAIIPDPAI